MCYSLDYYYLFIFLKPCIVVSPVAPNDYKSYKARQGFESRCLKRESEPLKFPTTFLGSVSELNQTWFQMMRRV